MSFLDSPNNPGSGGVRSANWYAFLTADISVGAGWTRLALEGAAGFGGSLEPSWDNVTQEIVASAKGNYWWKGQVAVALGAVVNNPQVLKAVIHLSEVGFAGGEDQHAIAPIRGGVTGDRVDIPVGIPDHNDIGSRMSLWVFNGGPNNVTIVSSDVDPAGGTAMTPTYLEAYLESAE